MFQKVAKTGKKDYRLPSNSFVPLIHFFCIHIIGVYLGKCGIVYGTCVSIHIIGVYLGKCGIVYGTCVSAQLRHSTSF